MAVNELSFRISADPAAVRSALAQVRAELTQTAQVQKSVSQGELSMRSQLSAASSLQRQRSAALISEWKKQETQAARTAAGLRPFSHDVDRLTGAMSLLSSSTSALQGPMGGIASRISALTSITREFTGAQDGATQASSAYASQLIATGTPVGAAILGAVAMAAALVTVGNALFQATKSAAEYKGKLHDLSQQTGVSVETLRTLEVMARTTGGSIESITQSLVIFQGKLDEAQDASSKTAAQFAQLGISTNNTEDAFRDALKALSEMEVGYHQTNEAAELFGRRAGKQMLAILKEMHGDLDKTTEKLQAMGLMISTEDAAAADAFNDQLVFMQLQLQALTAVIGSELMPMMLSAVKQVSKGVGENREALQALASIIKLVVEPAVVAFTRVLTDAANVISFASRGFRMANNALIDLAQGYDIATAAARQYNNEAARASVAGLGATGGAGGDGADRPPPEMGDSSYTKGPAWMNRRRGGGGGGSSTANKEAREFEQRQERITAYTLALTDAFNKLDAEIDGVNTSTKLYAVQQDVLNGVLREATVEVQKAALADAQEIDNKTNLIRLRKELVSYAEKLQEVIRQNIEGDKSYLRQSQELIKSLEKQGAVLGATTTAWLQIMGGMASAKDTAAAMIPIMAELADEMHRIPLFDPNKNVLSGEQVDELSSPPPPPPVPTEVIDSWTILKQTSMDAISSMAQGIGSLIQQWVLYGSAGPNAIRKMIAAVLAGAAAQASIEAIMQVAHAAKEYALGLAAASNPLTMALAPGHFAAAKAHLVAAAVYAGVGAAAAISGRVVAGGAFAGAAGGSAATGGGGSGTRSEAPESRDVGRRKADTGPERVEVILKLSGGLEQVIEGHVINNWRSNGRIRTVVQNDGG